MNYSEYSEVVLFEDGKYVVQAQYEFNGVTFEDVAVVDTVTEAHAALRKFRAEFRDELKGRKLHSEAESQVLQTL